MPTTRREALVQIALSLGAATSPLDAQQGKPDQPPQAQHANHAAAGDQGSAPAARKVFTDHEFKTLQTLSEWIIPADERSKGGMEAGTAEFIDYVAGADPRLQAQFTGGLAWLDHQMRAAHGKPFLDCTREQQKEMLDLIAHRDNAAPDLAPGVEFFAVMRAWTVDAFASSKIGIEYLGYIGNTALSEFNGCPDTVVKQLLDRTPI